MQTETLEQMRDKLKGLDGPLRSRTLVAVSPGLQRRIRKHQVKVGAMGKTLEGVPVMVSGFLGGTKYRLINLDMVEGEDEIERLCSAGDRVVAVE